MQRRDFCVLSGAAAVAQAVAGLAQASKAPRIGILVLGNPDPAPFLSAFREGLRDLGYSEGQNIALEIRSADGEAHLLPTLARELVGLKVDVIVGFQTPALLAAKDATSDIPIVMGLAGDPVVNGLIASFARPGGNVTGMAAAGAQMVGKLLEITREMLPAARHVSLMANAPDPYHRPFVQHAESAGRSLGLAVRTHLLQSPNELESAFARSAGGGAHAVVIQPSLPHRRSAELALKHRLPAFSHGEDFVAVGGLASYAADYPAVFRQSGTFVDLILKGRKPADLPVQMPTRYLLVINLRTAAALGLKLPPSLLIRTDRVIE